MRRWFFAALLVACTPRSAERVAPPAADAAAPTPPSTSDAGTSSPNGPLARIAGFAAKRGGLHGAPVRIGWRTFKLPETPAWLFFVGGDGVALAAWTATQGDFPKGRIPNVSASVPSEHDGDLVFELVESWPHAVRVLGATPSERFTDVAIESLAARDQPAGLRAVVRVEEAIGNGSPMRAQRSAPLDIGATTPMTDAEAAASVARLKKASPASVIGAQGADVYAVWQDVFSKKLDRVDPKNVATSRPAIAKLLPRISSCAEGHCIAERRHDEGGRGRVVLGKDGNAVSFVVDAPAPAAETAPAPADGDDAIVLEAFRPVRGAVRSIARARVGDERYVSVVVADAVAYLVEREGPRVVVTDLSWVSHAESAEIRIVDVDGDGVADVVVRDAWPPAADDAPGTLHARHFVWMRGARVDDLPDRWRSAGGREVAMLGARDIDDAVKRAGTQKTYAAVSKVEACATLRAAATPKGLRAHATADAMLVEFFEPGQPAMAARIVAASAASKDDASALENACKEYGGDMRFVCEGTTCGNLGHALGSYYRFVREPSGPKLALALIYTGS